MDKLSLNDSLCTIISWEFVGSHTSTKQGHLWGILATVTKFPCRAQSHSRWNKDKRISILAGKGVADILGQAGLLGGKLEGSEGFPAGQTLGLGVEAGLDTDAFGGQVESPPGWNWQGGNARWGGADAPCMYIHGCWVEMLAMCYQTLCFSIRESLVMMRMIWSQPLVPRTVIQDHCLLSTIYFIVCFFWTTCQHQGVGEVCGHMWLSLSRGP